MKIIDYLRLFGELCTINLQRQCRDRCRYKSIEFDYLMALRVVGEVVAILLVSEGE